MLRTAASSQQPSYCPGMILITSATGPFRLNSRVVYLLAGCPGYQEKSESWLTLQLEAGVVYILLLKGGLLCLCIYRSL